MTLAALLLQVAAPAGPPPYCKAPEIVRGPLRTFDGVWFDGFEDERFFEGATSVSDLPWRSERIAVGLRDREVWRASPPDIRFARDQYHLYRVSFEGRTWRMKPYPAGCLPPPPSPGGSRVGIAATSISHLVDLGPYRSPSNDQLNSGSPR